MPLDTSHSRFRCRFSDNQPRVCVACGRPATGEHLERVRLPADAMDKTMGGMQLLAALFGVLLFWWRDSADKPEFQWLRLPVCDQHGQPPVQVAAVTKHQVQITGASPEYVTAFEQANGPPSPEMLAALDQGSDTPEESIRNIDDSSVQTPDDFLRGLGER